MLKKLLPAALLATGALAAPLPPPGPLPPAANQKLAHDILRDLVAVRSVHDIGTAQTANILKGYFLKAGFAPSDLVLAADPKHPQQVNLVVRLHGKGKARPILYLGHTDIVDARPQDWSEAPPFQLTEKNGFLYGRGTTDMKNGDAAVAASLIRLKQEGFTPSRDIIAAFTADEEVGEDQDGVKWLVKNRRELVDAAFAINVDGASGELLDGKRLDYGVETSQKVYLTWHLSTTNKGGHSSEPRPDNAIYQLSEALTKLSRYSFPITLTDTTRAYFTKMAALQGGACHCSTLALRTLWIASSGIHACTPARSSLSNGTKDPASGSGSRVTPPVATPSRRQLTARTTCCSSPSAGSTSRFSMMRSDEVMLRSCG